MNISIIGGDLRIVRLAEMYSLEEDKNIYTFGLEKYFKQKDEINCNNSDNGQVKINSNNEKIKICNTLTEAISDIIISGMPFSKDKIFVNTPFSDEKIEIKELAGFLEGKTFIAGGIPEIIKENEKIKTIDLLESEELTILNAIPTVEGAIKIAIEEREETIHESTVLICGYGRIGKILCDRFRDLGANVYCVARKGADLAWIREKSCIPLRYDELYKYAKEFDIVINTVPTKILNKNELDSFRKDVTIIDLASNPGGVDEDYAKELGIKLIIALGIPGKEQPTTAAKYIKETIDKNFI